MSTSYNHATFIGNLGRDPDVRYTSQGTAVCSFSMAVNNRKKIDGEWKDDTMWIKVTVWGKAGETAGQFLQKGRPCLVEGRVGTEEWADKDGKQRFNLTLNANSVTFLGDKPQGEPSTNQNKPTASKGPASPEPGAEITDDDIPF